MNEEYKRNLAVPFFTQRDNTYIWQQLDLDTNLKIGPKYPMAWRTCNITSLCMILHYWGLTKETPNQMIEKVFAKTEDDWKWLYEETTETGNPRKGAARLENWSDLKKIAELYIEGKEYYKVIHGGKGLTLKLLQEQISKGYPVMISTGLGSVYGSGETDGHIVVVRGFTDNDDVILNDPFGIPVDNENRIRQTGTSDNIYGWYYLSDSASIGDNIIIDKADFSARYAAKSTSQYIYIEGPLWQEPGGIEADLSNSYPIKANNMWHDGIHLKSANGFYSIGSGRLVAARNAEVKEHGSSSFALVKYQMPNQEKKFFYALYMHLKKIDLKKELSDFILHNQGNVGKELKGIWYEQIFTNILPNYKIISFKVPKKIDSSNYSKIYKAKFNGYKLQPTNELADVLSTNGILSRHAKLYMLPAKPDLINKISNIENYDTFETLKFMIKCRDSDFKDENGYYYFFCGNNGQKQLCCCKNELLFGDAENKIFASYNIVNEPSYKYYTDCLYKLYKGENIIFNKIDTSTKNDKLKKIVPTKVLNESVLEFMPVYFSNSNFLLGIRSKNGSDCISTEQIFNCVKYDIKSVINDIEYIFITFVETGKSASKETLKKYIDEYIDKRKTQLENFLKETTRIIGDRNADFGSIEKKTDIEWMKELFEDAEKKIDVENSIGKKGNYDITKDYKFIRNEFDKILSEYKKKDLINSIAICEFLMIEFASLPKEKLTKDDDRFKFISFTEAGTFNFLYTNWSKLLEELKELYLDFFNQRYIDNYIEIPKGVKLGKGSDIPDADGKESDSIHFEIFSKEKLITGDFEVKDADEDNFYNPGTITEKILSALNLSDKEKKEYTKYAEDNVITKKEIKKIYTQKDYFQKMITYHCSEWKMKKYTDKDISDITNKKTKVKGKKELIKTIDYYNDYYSKYNWDKNLEKELDVDKFYYYHPSYFIEKLLEQDSKKKQ